MQEFQVTDYLSRLFQKEAPNQSFGATCHLF